MKFFRLLFVILIVLLFAAPTLAESSNKNKKGGGGGTNTIVSNEFREAASSAAAMYVAECGSGISGQGMGGGGALTVRAPICDVMLLLEYAGTQCIRERTPTNPMPNSCKVRNDMFSAAVEMTEASLGAGRWRGKVRRFLPSVIAWMF